MNLALVVVLVQSPLTIPKEPNFIFPMLSIFFHLLEEDELRFTAAATAPPEASRPTATLLELK
ncbi:hypothetical protein CDL15_Pgr014021 [Punica granatum]|uniref:Uncharacterized protein n=1 Tax=Punica granatum TaxID=22663 RepID=A0A218WB49_PUNGR|nr:hypothetical protein CDL15_Pgr014021 [Punica granatum]